MKNIAILFNWNYNDQINFGCKTVLPCSLLNYNKWTLNKVQVIIILILTKSIHYFFLLRIYIIFLTNISKLYGVLKSTRKFTLFLKLKPLICFVNLPTAYRQQENKLLSQIEGILISLSSDDTTSLSIKDLQSNPGKLNR